MSLQLAAQHLSHQGRGPDDTLVHMSKNELRSLSDLANAHGGQLTINPDTGLPEAGILDKLLPTIVGAGLTYFSGGAINPMTAGFITGGIETLRSGSLEKGLMAGLGAYGGAGLTAGLTGAGEAAIGMGARDAAVQSATQQGLTGEAYNKAIQDQVTQQMAEKATPFGSISEGASQLFKEPGKVVDAMGGGFQTAKYAAGAAAPYLADSLKPTTDCLRRWQTSFENDRFWPLRFGDAFLPQFFTLYLPATRTRVPDGLAAAMLIFSLVLLLVFCWFNRELSGVWMLALGLSCNLLVMAANGGFMPISTQTASRLVPPETLAVLKNGDRFGYKDTLLLPGQTRLAWLSDHFLPPERFPYQVAISLGDGMIAVGAFWLMVTQGKPLETQQVKLKKDIP